MGEPVGIIAANSIGEPTEQFVLDSRRTGCGNHLTETLSLITALFEASGTNGKMAGSLHKILEADGLPAVQAWLLNALQSIYSKVNMHIQDKHFEIVIRKMSEKVKIADPGDTIFLRGELAERHALFTENANTTFDGGRAAKGKPVILGITKAAQSGNSWVASAAFRDTTATLTKAAVSGAMG